MLHDLVFPHTQQVMREKSSDGSTPPTTNGTSAARRGDDEEEEEEDDLPVFPSPPALESQVSQVSQMSQASQGSSQSEGPGRPDDRTLGETNPSFSQTASDDDSKTQETLKCCGNVMMYWSVRCA